jgi:Mn-dependent DtxR family transcriptional regulator
MSLYSSGEMYLETIYILSKKSNTVRALDVAEKMNFSKPSVSRALKKLINDGFIEVNSYGYITLSDKGKDIAEKIFERHNILTQMLINLGIDEKTAAEDACKIEHDISDKSFEAIKKHMNSYNK